MPTIHLYRSRRSTYKFLAMNIFMFSASLVGIYVENTPIMLWIGVVLFGIGTSVALYQLWDKAPQLSLDTTGINSPSLGKQWINWEAIREAHRTEINGQEFICFIIDASIVVHPSKSFRHRTRVVVHNTTGQTQALNLWIAAINYDTTKLLQTILLLSRTPQRERAQILSARFEQV